MIKPRYTLITNLDYVVVGGARKSEESAMVTIDLGELEI